jgi:predicted metal-dependent hydrolase
MPSYLIEEWARGVSEFNEARFWEAHEAWEKNWARLPEPGKTYVQALIQVAAALHLAQKRRWDPARRLCALAHEKLTFSRPLLEGVLPRIEIPGAAASLQGVLQARADDAFELRLKAVLLLPPGL